MRFLNGKHTINSARPEPSGKLPSGMSTGYDEMTDKEEWRLVILGRDGSELLLRTEGGKYCLPKVEIPKWQRIAENLTSCIKERWNVDSVCLLPLVGPRPTDFSSGPQYYQVLESRSNGSTPSDLRWVNEVLLGREDLTRSEDFDILRRARSQTEAAKASGPFAKIGWLDELLSWIKPHLHPLGLTLTGNFKQLNASPSFSLIRLETDGPAVWFKAVGEPNLHEYEITTTLAQRHPRYFPKIIAIHPDWHGWLMEEANGAQLNDALRLEHWQIAVRSLASLQKDSAGESSTLVQAGCRDRRVASLLDLIDPFLEVIADLMQQQPKTPPVILTQEDLLKLGRILKETCARLQALGVPDSLGHCDFNPGNIIVTKGGCVFLDWAEAYAGCPFVTFEYLLAHLHKDHPERASWTDLIRQAYADEWKTFISAENRIEAFRLAPLLAVFVYALDGDAWRDPQRLRDPNLAKHMRSLSRRMHREAQALADLEVPCTSC